MTADTVEGLLRHPGLWRAGGGSLRREVVASGFASLDAMLPDGGWPLGELIEILPRSHGIGELNLLLPALRSLLGDPAQAEGWVAWLVPPYTPYAPALLNSGLSPARMLVVDPARRDPGPACWALEQALRSTACVAVLAWLDRLPMSALRRLKLAAGEGRVACFLFRPRACETDPSPASLRIALQPGEQGIDLCVLKNRSGYTGWIRRFMA